MCGHGVVCKSPQMRPAAVVGQKRMEGFGGARLGRSRASCPTQQTNVLLAIARLRRFACEVSAQTKNHPRGRFVFGGARRDRTADLNTASVALSQLSYSPKSRDARLRLRRIGVKPNTLLLSL